MSTLSRSSLALLCLALALPARAEEGAPREDERSLAVPALHSAALLGGMRLGVSLLWPGSFDPFEEGTGAQFVESWTHAPEFRADRTLLESDGDPWVINGVGHALFGSDVYLRMRQCGHGPAASVLAAATASTVWEYGIEAFHKRPSAIDLVWTPLAGALVGEGRWRLHRWFARTGGVFGRVGRALVDPLGELERGLGADC